MAITNSYIVGDMSPSLLYNNLSCVGSDNACFYASGTHVCCARTTSGKAELQLQMSNAILCLRAMVLPGQTSAQALIVVASATQCLLYQGGKLVTNFEELYGNGAFAGCCDMNAAASKAGPLAHIALGGTAGTMLYVTVSPDLLGSVLPVTVIKSPVQRSHEGGRVTAIAVGTPGAPRDLAAVTGDMVGRIILWASGEQGHAPTPHSMIPASHESDCVTSIAILSSRTPCPLTSPTAAIAVAYGCGKVRLYGIAAGDLRVEICAHSKWINAIRYSPLTSMLATTGEDSVIEVFHVNTTSAASTAATLVSTAQMANALPTGVDFTANGRALVVSAFNTPHLASLEW